MKLLLIILLNIVFLSAAAQIGIKDITWILTKIEDKKEKTTVTLSHDHSILRFNDSTYSGYGCNAFSGKYKINGNKIIFLGGMEVSDNLCTQPEDFKAEAYVLKDFTQLEYKQTAENLILTKGATTIFTYRKKKEK
ncbi:MAG: META domain-containing protein [Bacteroidota bacterium]|nr:META domain-containing protein [Bacteroidota bacterium]